MAGRGCAPARQACAACLSICLLVNIILTMVTPVQPMDRHDATVKAPAWPRPLSRGAVSSRRGRAGATPQQEAHREAHARGRGARASMLCVSAEGLRSGSWKKSYSNDASARCSGASNASRAASLPQSAPKKPCRAARVVHVSVRVRSRVGIGSQRYTLH